MSRTTTKFPSFETLHIRGASAAPVVKLMMACNDLSLANQALDDWKKEQPKPRQPRQLGARMYFVRVELAHLFEAMQVIDQIRKSPGLLALVGQCDSKTQESFRELGTFLPDGINRKEFERLVGQVRHNLTFHYYQCDKQILRAIEDCASRAEARISSITRANTGPLWHFKLADDVVDSIVVRQIWSVPRSKDDRAAVDAVADRVHQIFLWFMDFSGEFIWKYFEQ